VDERRPALAAALAVIAVIAVAGCGVRARSGARADVPGGRPGSSRSFPGKHLPPARPLTGPLIIDLSWTSSRRGWALEAEPCGRGLCPRLAGTADGGRSWRALPSPPGVIQYRDGAPELAQIRFATARIGYLSGPALYRTADGGQTWHRVPGPPTEALHPADGSVVRVAYRGTGCPGPCTRIVQEAAAGTTRWRTLLRITLPLDESQAVTSQVIRSGRSVIYVPVYGNLAAGAGTQHTVIFRTTGGGTWQRLPDPCPGTGTATRDTTGIAAGPGGFLAALCAPRDQTGHLYVLTSADHGSTWSMPRPLPATGTDYLIAAASPGRLAVATGGASGSGPYAYRLLESADGGRHWTTAAAGTAQLNPRAPAVAGLGFASPDAGWWISDPHSIWITSDGGRTWHRHPIR